MANTIEKGSIFIFYRNKIDKDKAECLDDVRRTYLALVPDNEDKARLFMIGKKRLPEIHEGQAKSTEREWLMNIANGTPKEIAEEFYPMEYETKTRGTRREDQAIPAAEGRYEIFESDDATQLAYKLSNPKKPGKAQRELGIFPEASYVISVKNPEMNVPGFPDEKPGFPKQLKEKFARRRWNDIDDPKFLDYENAQFTLIGAHKDLSDLDVSLSGSADVFKTFKLKKNLWPADTLYFGEFCSATEKLEAFQLDQRRSRGGEKGGKAALKSASAAGVASSLKGVDFPKRKDELKRYASDHGANDEVVEVLSRLPDKKFKDMSEVQKGLKEAS